jgi:hypothetical protein
MKKLILALVLCFLNGYSDQSIKIKYPFTNDPIDVVIPCHEKDIHTLNLVIQGIKENGKNIRRVIVVSSKKLSNLAEWVPESIFPFTKNDLALIISHGNDTLKRDLLRSGHIGWIYQQFLKLYSPFVIKNISPNVLILDAETIFLNPVEFMNKDGEPYFSVSIEVCEAYYTHMAKLLGEPFSIKKVFRGYSGICHHMLMQKSVLEDLFGRIERESGKKAWEALCLCIDVNKARVQCMSEYEIYFNFIMANTDQARIRNLKWRILPYDPNVKNEYKKKGYHFITCHFGLKK